MVVRRAYYRAILSSNCMKAVPTVPPNLHSPERQLIELRMEHADLDAMVDRLVAHLPVDELMLQRLKKRRLALRDRMARLAFTLEPKEPA
jgi:hypothetical protein